MMCVVMGVRDRDALARACDLGLAMQLTNIARDMGDFAQWGECCHATVGQAACAGDTRGCVFGGCDRYPCDQTRAV